MTNRLTALALVALLREQAVANTDDGVCSNRFNPADCWFLMSNMNPNSPCTCHNFCNGVFIGCDTDYGDAPCLGELVCGCHTGDLVPGNTGCTNGCGVPPTTPTVPISAPVAAPLPTAQTSVETPTCLDCPPFSFGLVDCVTSTAEQCACNEGYFKSSPAYDAPCIPCLSCGPNGFAKTNCVQDATDANQCGCFSGFQPNGSGGCTPVPAPVAPVPAVPAPVSTMPVPVGQGSLPTCLTCPENSYASTSCVTSLVDQCYCNQGFYQSNLGEPCVPCLSCGANAFPLANCVRDVSDPMQCGCPDGYNLSWGGDCIATSPSCLTCGHNKVPTVNCVTNPSTECRCMDRFFDSGDGGCLPCLTCPANTQTGVYCVTDVATQCFCQAGYQGPSPFQCSPIPQQSCLQCPFNLVASVGCVSDPVTQCACPAGQEQQGGRWCYPAFPPVSPPVMVGNPWNSNPRTVPSPPVPAPVPVTMPVRSGQLVPSPLPLPPSVNVTRPDEVECDGKGKSGKGKGGKGKGGESGEGCGKSGNGKSGKGKGGKGKGESISKRDSLEGVSGTAAHVSASTILVLLSVAMFHWP